MNSPSGFTRTTLIALLIGGLFFAVVWGNSCVSSVTNALASISSITLPTLPTLPDGNVWIGDASNDAVANAISGDIALSNTGVATVQADSVALTTDTTGNYVASVATSSPLGGGAAGSEGATLTLTCATCATSSNNLSFFATTTSSQLAGVLSDETGSGALVFGTSPAISGTVTTTGLTLPAFTAGGNITGGSGFTVGTSAGNLVLSPAGDVTTAALIASTNTTDATSPTAAAVKTAGGFSAAKKGWFGDRVEVATGYYSRVATSATGPWLKSLVASKNIITDNTLTGFLRVTVPSTYASGIIKLDYIIMTEQTSRFRMGGLFIYMARTNGVDTVKGSAVYIAEQTLLPVGSETLTVTFTLSANSGAAGDTQTFDVQVTIDSDANQVGFIKYQAELLANYYNDTLASEITMAGL